MATELREGSMAAANAKNNFRFVLVASGIALLIFLCNYVFNTALKDYMQQAWGKAWHFVSILLYIVAIGSLWVAISKNPLWGKARWVTPDNARWIFFIGLGLGIGASGGFHGI